MVSTIKKFLRHFGLDIVFYRSVFDKALEKYNIDTVLDIGANAGQFAEEIHKQLPRAKIYSFEPLKDIFLRLQEKTNTIPNFKAFNIGLGEKNGSAEIERSSFSLSSSFLPMGTLHKKLYPKSAETYKETVDVRRLDDVTGEMNLSGNILIKIDVQGFENAVINGGKATISKAKVLLLETSFVELYVGQPLFDDIYRLLKPLGFKYIGRQNQHWNKAGDEIIYEDSVFVKVTRDSEKN